MSDNMAGEKYSESGHPLYVDERKKPKNLWDMRSAREAMSDRENEARKFRNNVVR